MKKIWDLDSKISKINTTPQEIILLAFLFSVISQFISFITSSYNIGIMGVCVIYTALIALTAIITIVMHLVHSTPTPNQEICLYYQVLFITIIFLLLHIMFLLAVDFFVSIGLEFFAFRPFIAMTFIFLLLTMTYLIQILQNFNQRNTGENDMFDLLRIIFKESIPSLRYFTIILGLSIISLIFSVIISLLEIIAFLSDFFINIVLLILLYLPIASLYLAITNKTICGDLNEDRFE